MTNKLSYMHKVCTGKARFLDSSGILFHFLRSGATLHSLVLFTLTLSHIIATRIGLDLACMTCIFQKFIDLCDQTTGNKDGLGFIYNWQRSSWFQSIRQSSLWYKEIKILCTYPRKRKDFRSLQMFHIGDLSLFLAGGLTCIRSGDLFVLWSGSGGDQAP